MDIGRLLAIAEYPDESMLTERMKHDWRIGASLLDAVRQGRLCVRDCRTRFPLKPDAPSVDVLPSLVSVNDFREFVAELGYAVQVGDVSEGSTSQDVPAPSERPLVPATQAGPDIAGGGGSFADESASNTPVVPFKKSAFIAAYVHEWPTIKRDIDDAASNGLAAAAKSGARGWLERPALIWARANGKLITAPKPAASLAQAMHNLNSLPSRKHTLQG